MHEAAQDLSKSLAGRRFGTLLADPPWRFVNRTGKVVYSWTIAPPARTLPAGASASFNSAEVNVPPGGDELTITLGEPRA